MATKLEKLKWKLYEKKRNFLLLYGAKNGLVKLYDEELFSNLRHVYYGGIPVSIILLCDKLSNGHCYDRGPLVTLGFGESDFKVVDADVDGLRLKPDYIDKCRQGELSENYINHCFAERIADDGTTWVYDTSLGLVFEKKLYYKMENPKITTVNDKKTTQEFLYYDFIKDSDIEKDKYALPLILPNFESYMLPIQEFYREQLKKEIDILKKEVNYDSVCAEIDEDMKKKGFKK